MANISERHRREGRPVEGGDAEEQPREGARRRERRAQADEDAEHDHARALPDHHAPHRGRAGAEGHPHADLARALGDHAGEHAVEAHRAQEERQRRHDAEREQREGEMDHRPRRETVHRVGAVDRRLRRDLADQRPDVGRDRLRARRFQDVGRRREPPCHRASGRPAGSRPGPAACRGSRTASRPPRRPPPSASRRSLLLQAAAHRRSARATAPSGRRAADHHPAGRRHVIGGLERPAVDHVDAHGAEVVARREGQGERPAGVRAVRHVLAAEAIAARALVQRDVLDDPDRRHAGQRAPAGPGRRGGSGPSSRRP